MPYIQIIFCFLPDDHDDGGAAVGRATTTTISSSTSNNNSSSSSSSSSSNGSRGGMYGESKERAIFSQVAQAYWPRDETERLAVSRKLLKDRYVCRVGR